jgi:ribosome biogenesis GTPase
MAEIYPHSTTLTALGWDERYAEQYAAMDIPDSIPARIARVERGGCDALSDAGLIRLPISSTRLSLSDTAITTGDWAVARGERDNGFELIDVLPRRSAILRATSDRTSAQQVLAANVDTVLIAVSLGAPIKIGRIERLLAIAWTSGAQPVIVLTKSDLCEDPDTAWSTMTTRAPGVEVIVTSSSSRAGLDILTESITGTAVLLGASGAGKSSLANALLGAERLATREVRDVDGKGRHTTVHRELLPLPGGGVLIDTPGLRSIGLPDAAAGVEKVFGDIEDLAGECRFRDCGHRSEPGCAVQDAIARGVIDGERLDRFRALLRESEWQSMRSDTRKRNARKKRDKEIARQQRAMYRSRGHW